jgi:oligoribonuclease NrnB/cAMP/cGMP phosphodiesterase (DHH superfamily)
MIVLYHANCNDGSASALAAWLKLGDKGHQYIAVRHGQPPPTEVAGQDVLIVDFCYARQVLLAMNANSIHIIDHHISAKKDLAVPFDPQSKITAHFDMNRCGAVLTWQHFFPDQEVPLLLKYVQDRDIWTNEYPESTFLTYGLNVFSTNFRDWKVLIDQPDQLQQAIASGRSIYHFIDIEAEKLMANRAIHTIGDFELPVVNAPGFLASDILHKILLADPSAPFVASYQDNLNLGVRNYSLRSEDHRQDVSVIAKKFGGGGHANAAGFSIPIELSQLKIT